MTRKFAGGQGVIAGRSIVFALVVAVSLSVSSGGDEEGYIIRGNQRTVEEIQKIYAEIPPVRYRPPADRWENLPKTRKLLTEGGTLHVVMLGDSIVNDISRSGWDLIVERRHPKCLIEKVTSVRGSTGCWWYKEPGRVKKFVLDHRPDLVIIGGISQRNDIGSIREVVRQIQNAAGADILLMTGAFGQTDPRDDAQWQKISDPNHYTDYRRRLEELADDMGAAFLDMEAAWGRYIRDSGKDLDWFKRDPIHANERGEQILGHILANYLSYPPTGGRSAEDWEIDPFVWDKLDTFQDWKFGFMMHWGIYSQWGCIESWPLVEADKWARPDDLPAWTERGKDFKRFFRDYVAFNKTFNPQKFDPGRWVAAAKDAGMKYVVFTTAFACSTRGRPSIARPIRAAESVRLLGSDAKLEWTLTPSGWSISIPESVRRSPPCRDAWAFEIHAARTRQN
jgi:hypothetical protein